MFKSIVLFLFVSIAWAIGLYELVDIFRHFSEQWHWYVIATVYTIIVNEIFVHRICGHINRERPINTNTWTYKILVFLVSVDHAYGPVSSMCLLHNNHHAYADKQHDTLNYRTTGYTNCILSPLVFLANTAIDFPNKVEYLAKQQQIYSNILEDNWTVFCENYKIPLTIIFWTVLYFVFPIILFKVIFVGRVIISVLAGWSNVLGHMKLPFGYKNFNNNNTTYNHLILYYLTFCLFNAMLHNNHHGIKNINVYSVRWFEFDLSKYVVKLLTTLMK